MGDAAKMRSELNNAARAAMGKLFSFFVLKLNKEIRGTYIQEGKQSRRDHDDRL